MMRLMTIRCRRGAIRDRTERTLIVNRHFELARNLPAQPVHGPGRPACPGRTFLGQVSRHGAGLEAQTECTRMDPSKQEQFMTLIGGFPNRPDLDLEVIDEVDLHGIRRQLVTFQSVEGEHIEAFVLMPTLLGNTTRPAIVAIHQDGGVRPYRYGKSEVAGLGGDPDLCYGEELCARGYVVICPDRFGFESRSLARSRHRETFEAFAIQSSSEEYPGLDLTEDLFKGALANKRLFDGWTMLAQELFEVSRAVDVLCTNPQVDAERIGVIGHSAGGLLAAYAMYVDPRLRVGGASCGTWLFRNAFQDDLLRPMQGFGNSLAVPGMRQWGDTNTVLAGLAPRPFIERSGDRDPGDEPEELLSHARTTYRKLNASGKFDYAAVGGGHGFAHQSRQEMYDWFGRWL